MKRRIWLFTGLLLLMAFGLSGFAAADDSDIPVADSSSLAMDRFIGPDGRIDLDAIRASGFQGELDIDDFDIQTDPVSDKPYLAPKSTAVDLSSSHPDDFPWQPGWGIPGTNGRVMDFTVFKGQLITAGSFDVAGDAQVRDIAAWNGSSWNACGFGSIWHISALAVYKGMLVAAGRFDIIGRATTKNIAVWYDGSWWPMGDGLIFEVCHLAVYGDKLIAAGALDICLGLPFCYGSGGSIAAWDGTNWSSLGSGLNGNIAIAFALAEYNSQLWVGGYFTTAGDKVSAYIAVWDEFATDAGDDTPETMPESFHLAQNYPNPFNPTTNIEFDLPSRAHVTLEIFNVLGQKVRTLINEDRVAGPYREVWDGTDDANRAVSTGVYLYRLKTGDFAEVKKMILLK